MNSVIEQVVKALEELSEPAQSLVLSYAETLREQQQTQLAATERYPLRGTVTFVDYDPAEPVLSADAWDAVRGVLIDDSH